jgi:23S rRNA (cytidine2498-2'-O)-methyltransferase
MNPRFYFASCQIGAEKAVKAEVLSEYPQLRFAFSRPGFITFKEESNAKPPLVLKKNIFTRLWGEVVGQGKDLAALQELIKLIPQNKVVHFFDRDQFVPGDEPENFIQHSHIKKIIEELGSFSTNLKPRINDEVFSLIWIDDFHVFLGRHIHSEKLSDSAGNIPSIELAKESPSRAYLKIEEAIYRFRPEIHHGLQVLEVGCSPGGATMAMSNRGLLVTGVDPKYMDQKIYQLPGFKFIQKCARDVKFEELKNTNPDWVVMDMNIAPLEALDELNHIVSLLRKNFGKSLKLRQGFLTIKLNDWKFAENIPLYLKRLEEIGFQELHPTQLCSNRQEFFVWAAKFKI